MEIPLQVTFRNTPPSKAVEAHVREKANKLDTFYNRIMGCRVVVEAPHRRRHKGTRYHVRIDMTVPGGELVVNRESGKRIEYEDVYVAVRDAFDAARRQLQNYAKRQRKEVKTHEVIPHARVGKLFLEKGFGFLELPDGREVYFHKNSVLEMPFDLMEVGMEVHFAEEQGEKGPQASTVRPIRKHHHRGPEPEKLKH
ncbi:MAG: HPF/RaiA family ribosome-associated protein [Candidatus Binatia bacterium]